MPPTTSKPAPKRKPPTFKPPRPAASSSKHPSASKPSKTPAPPRRKPAPGINKTKRPSFIPDEASASSSSAPSNNNNDDDDLMSSVEPLEPQHDVSELEQSDSSLLPATSTPSDPPPTIPPALLTRLLHHHFKDEGVRVGKEAGGVVGRYMETFVREAIARAAFERAEGEREGGGGGRWQGGFLEVEDLEKLAPQLLLDF